MLDIDMLSKAVCRALQEKTTYGCNEVVRSLCHLEEGNCCTMCREMATVIREEIIKEVKRYKEER